MAPAQKKNGLAEHCELRAITFDMGHTLLLLRRPLGEICADSARRAGVDIAPDRVGELFMHAWVAAQQTHAGLVFGTDEENARPFWRSVMRLVMQEFRMPGDALERMTEELYHVFGSIETWGVNPAWPAVRDELRSRGLRIGVVSNWDIRLTGILRELGIFDEFDSVVVSAEHAVEKPAPAIFRVAWTALGVAPEEALHIGDSWHDDICGASAAGMRAVWFNPNGYLVPDPYAPHPQVRCLSELPALLHNHQSMPF